MDKRQYQFDVTMKGTAAETTTAGIPTRTVCTGYNSTCTTASNNAAIKGDGSTAWVTIRDYEGATQVGQATNTISTGGLVSRSIRIGGLQYSMDEDAGNIPDWFVRNKWYQYVTVAYNSGDAPSGTNCTAGSNCLTLNLRKANSDILSARNNVRALVMVASEQLSGQSWPNARGFDYFEDYNVAKTLSNNFTLVDTDKDFIAAGVVVGDMVLNRTDGSRGTITSRSQTVINVALLSGGGVNKFNPGDRYSIDRFYKIDPFTYPFNKYLESTTFNDLIRIAVSCTSDPTKLCWSN